ncbi:Zinc finger protein [Nesidiocoris tenuis]|uniref:Zinc finger protein n=1 Tax=Nesidiocoris tenuis TaxID=355587 RepID=A0ABN7AVI4_9HEMI|nr:Zinc finger protein [Nesidiocoris tenuis]
MKTVNVREKAERPDFDAIYCQRTVDGMKTEDYLIGDLTEGQPSSSNKKSFACKYCEKQFTLQSNMKRHIKMKHLPPGQRLLVCHRCNFKTFDSDSLAAHKAWHANEVAAGSLARLSSFINVVEGARRVNLCRWRSLHLPQVRDSGGDQVPHFAPKFSCRNPSSANGYLWTRCDGTFEGFQRIMPGGRPRKAVAQSREEKLKEKRKAEQRRRERIRTNPEEYEKYKESERERYQKRKQKGYFKTADQLSKAALEERRKAVRERVRMHRNRKRALQDFLDRCRIYVGPPETPQHDNGNFQQIKREPVDENQPAVPSIQAAPGPSWKELWRKHERREIAKLRRKLEKEKKRADENCRRMREYKKLWQREVARHQVEGDGTPQGIAEGKPYECYHCGSRFVSLYSVRKHIVSSHPIDKIYKCKHCPYVNGLKYRYLGHLAKHRNPENSSLVVNCDICGATTRKSYLAKHVQICHSGTPAPYACASCDFKTWFIRDYQSHSYIHTGERPFGCHHCGHTAKRKSHIRMHIESCTKKRFSCPYCNFESRYQYEGRKHISQSHPGSARQNSAPAVKDEPVEHEEFDRQLSNELVIIKVETDDVEVENIVWDY